MIHSTSLLGLLKEFRGQNLQNFIPSASAYAFGRRPNFLKCELRLRPNVKNTALVIHSSTTEVTLLLKRWPCDRCDKSFASCAGKRKHFIIEHGDGGQFPCEICSRKMPSKGSLKYHVKQVHTKVKFVKE